MDDGGTTGEAGRWLSYAELAEVRGITRKAAARLTLRHGWRRQPGNDGATRVLVPPDIKRRQTARDDGPPAPPSDTAIAAALAAIREAHAGELAAMRDLLTAANARADRLDLLVETERGRIAAIEAKATAAEGELTQARAYADALRAKLTDAQGELAAAQAKAEASSAEVQTLAKAVNQAAAADAERRARGLLVRLRAAWRRE